MLTKTDLQQIKLLLAETVSPKGQNSRIDRISGVVGQLVEKVQDMNETLIEIKGKINLLPTKDEYFDSTLWIN